MNRGDEDKLSNQALFFDFFGVLYLDGKVNRPLLTYIHQKLLRRYRLGIITSTWDVTRYIDQQVRADFEVIIISSDVGLYKPDLAIFQLACTRLGVDPREAIMIDDIPENCEGATRSGMQSILYTNFDYMRQLLEKMLVQ